MARGVGDPDDYAVELVHPVDPTHRTTVRARIRTYSPARRTGPRTAQHAVSAEGEELIDRRKPKPATLDELATIVDHMPERTKLFVVLAAFIGLREGELLELRRFDVDGVTGRISVERKVEKDVDRYAVGACSSCGRVVGPPKTASGVRTVHVPPPFLPPLQQHVLEHTAPGLEGLLFPGTVRTT